MSSEQEGRSQQHRAHSVAYDWKGRLVILYYTGGPFPEQPDKVETGTLRSESGVFGLVDVDEIGVLVRKLVNKETEEADQEQFELEDRPMFIPWGSVNSIVPLKMHSEE